MRYSKVWIAILTVAMVSCGPKELTFDGESAESVEVADFHKSMLSTLDSATTFEFRGKAKFNDGQSDVTFGYEIRMQRDSVIWLDITDPFVGLKIARALIMPDSAVMYNRFESTWMAGGNEVIEESFQVSLNFEKLQSVLLGEPMYIPSDVDDINLTAEGTTLYAKVAGQPGDELFMYSEPLYNYTYAYSEGLPLLSQSVNDSLRTAEMNYTYQEGDSGIPYRVEMKMRLENDIQIKFDHSEVLRNVDLHIPFTIPSGYERIR